MITCVLDNNLRFAVKTVSAAISKRPQLPVLAMARLDAEPAQITLTATNLETALKVKIGARSEVCGSVCIPVGNFDTKPAKDDERLDLTLDSKGTLLTIDRAVTKGKETFRGMPEQEFPVTPNIVEPENQIAEIWNGKAFKRAVKFVLEATDNDRESWSVVHVAIANDTVTLTATDGLRIHRATIKAVGCKEFSGLVPAKSLGILAKVLHDEDLKLYTNGDKIGASWYDGNRKNKHTANVEWLSMLVDNKVVDYDKAIPTSYYFGVDVWPGELRSAIKSCKVFSDTLYLDIKRYTGKSERLEASAVLRSENPEVGDVTCELGIGYTVVPPQRAIALDSSMLLDAVDAFSKIAGKSEITIKINLPSDPIFIEASDGEITLSAAIAPKVKRDSDYRPRNIENDAVNESERQRREIDEAGREYVEMIRDTRGLPESIKTRDNLYSCQHIMNYRGEYQQKWYDIVETYNYIYHAFPGAPVPQMSMNRNRAA